jgi:hypothetical protein
VPPILRDRHAGELFELACRLLVRQRSLRLARSVLRAGVLNARNRESNTCRQTEQTDSEPGFHFLVPLFFDHLLVSISRAALAKSAV